MNPKKWSYNTLDYDMLLKLYFRSQYYPITMALLLLLVLINVNGPKQYDFVLTYENVQTSVVDN